ncbi:MAG: hypothetical protein LBI19_11100 [Oscillospiraceae bacterium]|jgi:hypothetical protein|nr:hypothetical protein [Oscillospiraceae bacterium]
MQKDRVSLAFTVEREQTGGALRQKDAEDYALRELEKAGIPAHSVVIEAFENQTGWLVFCTVECETDAGIYIRFEDKDDFLDAVLAHGTGGVQLRGWEAGGYTVYISGPRERVAAYAAQLLEYGHMFEAPEGYGKHLEEHSCCHKVI